MCFVWWASAVFVFYGLAVHAHALWGSPHANYALVAAAELPALLLNTLLLDRVGRRPLLTAAFMVTATALIAIPCLPECEYTFIRNLIPLNARFSFHSLINTSKVCVSTIVDLELRYSVPLSLILVICPFYALCYGDVVYVL